MHNKNPHSSESVFYFPLNENRDHMTCNKRSLSFLLHFVAETIVFLSERVRGSHSTRCLFRRRSLCQCFYHTTFITVETQPGLGKPGKARRVVVLQRRRVRCNLGLQTAPIRGQLVSAVTRLHKELSHMLVNHCSNLQGVQPLEAVKRVTLHQLSPGNYWDA